MPQSRGKIWWGKKRLNDFILSIAPTRAKTHDVEFCCRSKCLSTPLYSVNRRFHTSWKTPEMLHDKRVSSASRKPKNVEREL
jgi:hypothetical protein